MVLNFYHWALGAMTGLEVAININPIVAFGL